MKISKQARRDAKQLFTGCKSAGVLDEAKVRTAVAAVIAQKPRGHVGILHHFQRLVKLDIDRRTAVIESAVPLTLDFQARVNASLASKHGAGLSTRFATNLALIGGLRIKVGSDVYDGSVRGRLDALQDSF
ncbi:MAG: F0F1 ATP synthase subunit delta [Verrucomicrobia bacterium]|nr:F0F1 ATP synthase subunit delta [Verrucomicrobiota bacterium]